MRVTNLEDGSILLDQEAFVDKICQRFEDLGLDGRLSYPFDSTRDFFPHEDKLITGKPYLEAIGSLLYLAINTRPDISFSVGFLARFAAGYTEVHWKSVVQVLQFVKKTKNTGIQFRRMEAQVLSITAYSDTDFAGDHVGRRSTYGGIIYVSNFHPISWYSKLMKFVTLSSTEAEYGGLSFAVKEAEFIKEIMEDLGFTCEPKIKIYIDNKSALDIATQVNTKRSKHIDIRFHFLKDKIQDGVISLAWISTLENHAEILTKGLGRKMFGVCQALLPFTIIGLKGSVGKFGIVGGSSDATQNRMAPRLD